LTRRIVGTVECGGELVSRRALDTDHAARDAVECVVERVGGAAISAVVIAFLIERVGGAVVSAVVIAFLIKRVGAPSSAVSPGHELQSRPPRARRQRRGREQQSRVERVGGSIASTSSSRVLVEHVGSADVGASCRCVSSAAVAPSSARRWSRSSSRALAAPTWARAAVVFLIVRVGSAGGASSSRVSSVSAAPSPARAAVAFSSNTSAAPTWA
jgi:hypothetical protein